MAMGLRLRESWGGTGQESEGAYAGPAPEVSFVDLKVVGDDGSGLTSNLIQAIA